MRYNSGMTLTIELSPDAERALQARAADRGMEPSQLAALLVEHGELPLDADRRAAVDAAASAQRMFEAWADEDPVSGPEDLRERQAEFERFKTGMNDASLSGRPVYP